MSRNERRRLQRSVMLPLWMLVPRLTGTLPSGTGFLYEVPQVINKFAKDISVYNLVSRTGIDESEREKTFLNRYNAAIKFLLDVAKGTISIGVEDIGGGSEAANGFKMKSSGRVFSRENMRGW